MRIASILSNTNHFAIAVTIVVACCNASAGAQIPCRYELAATIQGPNCQFTGPAGLTPTAISPNGLYVTGWYAQCDTGDEAFLWIGPPPGTLFTIPRPPGIETAQGYDVNDSGTVTGDAKAQTCCGPPNGFVYKFQNNQWINFPPAIPGGWSGASAINNANTVVGYRTIGTDQYPRQAVIWTERTGFQELGMVSGLGSGARDISENGIVTGWTGSNAAFDPEARAFVFQAGQATIIDPIPAGYTSTGRCVNGAGHVGIQGMSQSQPVILYHSYIYCFGDWIDLPTPTGFDRTFPNTVSDTEFVVGACSNSANGSSFRACVWQSGKVSLLKYRITPVPWNPNLSNSATDVANDGAILVNGRLGTGSLQVAFIIRPLPQSPDDPKCCSFPGDANCDQIINIDDLVQVVTHWGPCKACPSDLDHNNVVNIDDLVMVITHWSP